ncbi:AI-2E family transporter [Ruminococcaceae bacterium OttesenSCG-928-L11]|nr:AI-2E family transporter [Ruminococcaceae bacterium OttesenSCG-928-L11]
MKFEKDSKMTRVAIHAFLVLAAAILFHLLLQHMGTLFGWVGRVTSILLPVVYGFVIAFILNPMTHFFEDKLLPRLFRKGLKPRTARGLSILFTYLTTLILLALFFALVVPQIIYSLVGIGANVPSYLKSIQTTYYNIVKWMEELEFLEDSQSSAMVAVVFEYILGAFEGLLERLGEWLTRDFLDKVVNIATSFTSGVLDAILGIIISIYFLSDREKLFAQLRKISTALFRDSTTSLFHELAMDANKVFNGFIVGKIIDSLIIGVLCFIGMTVMRLPFAVLISVIVGVTNIIPYFGPFIGAIPGFVLVLISDPAKGPGQSLLFLIFILVLQQFDGNILGPKILGDTTGLSALWVIFSITLFSGLFGVLGMFIGVPLFAFIYNICRRIINHILKKRDLSTDTKDYDSQRNPMPD